MECGKKHEKHEAPIVSPLGIGDTFQTIVPTIDVLAADSRIGRRLSFTLADATTVTMSPSPFVIAEVRSRSGNYITIPAVTGFGFYTFTLLQLSTINLTGPILRGPFSSFRGGPMPISLFVKNVGEEFFTSIVGNIMFFPNGALVISDTPGTAFNLGTTVLVPFDQIIAPLGA